MIEAVLLGFLLYYVVGAALGAYLSLHIAGFEEWAKECPVGGRVGVILAWPVIAWVYWSEP